MNHCSQKGIIPPAVSTDVPSIISSSYPKILGVSSLLMPIRWLFRSWVCWRRQSTMEGGKNGTFFIKVPVTTLWYEILVFNLNTDFNSKFIIFCLYFLLYLKYRFNNTTGSMKWAFHFIFGFLQFIITNFLLKHLVYQHIEVSFIPVNLLVLYYCFRSLYLEREIFTNLHDKATVLFLLFVCHNLYRICEIVNPLKLSSCWYFR